jgi:hypothetical protein
MFRIIFKILKQDQSPFELEVDFNGRDSIDKIFTLAREEATSLIGENVYGLSVKSIKRL